MERAAPLLAEMEAFQGWMSEHFKLDDDGVGGPEKRHKTSFCAGSAPTAWRPASSGRRGSPRCGT